MANTEKSTIGNQKQSNPKWQNKSSYNKKNTSFAGKNSGPYHEASVLLNKLLAFSEKNNKKASNNNRSNIGGLKSIVFKTKTDSSSAGGASTTTEMICSKSTYATLCQTLQSKPLIDKLLDQYPPTPPSKEKKKHGKVLLRDILMNKCKNTGLLYILLHELLFSKFQKIKGGGGLKRVIVQFEPSLRSLQKSLHLTYDDIQKEKNSQEKLDSNQIIFPRYARVNTIKTTLEEVVSTLNSTTHKTDTTDDNGDDDDDEKLEPTEEKHLLLDGDKKAYLDAHIPHLLVLPPEIMKSDTAKFYSHPLLQEGKIILQDKASCFPALALVHATTVPSNSNDSYTGILEGDILDACAAPGNKTSHLAALLTEEYRKKEMKETKNTSNRKKNKKQEPWPKVIAFDRDKRRFEILKSRMSQLVSVPSAKTKFVPVHPIQTDFLQTSSTDPELKNVKSILLDPSCSGSGIKTSPDRNENVHSSENKEQEKDQNQRIQSLAKFQLTCLRHSMSFPQVERIVYSTCSIHDLENEGVVAAALGVGLDLEVLMNGGDKKENINNDWELIAPAALSSWKRRGKVVHGLSEAQASCLVRCDAEDGDETNGFFVSCFQRKSCKKSGTMSHSTGQHETVSDSFVEFIHKSDNVSLPIYNGEYKNLKIVKEETDNNKVVQGSSKEIENNQAQTKSLTKKEKKLLWKKRQREKKELRLKNKKLKEEE